MKINRFAVTIGVVAVAAFLVGRADLQFGNSAVAQDDKHAHDHAHGHDHGGQMSAELMQMMQKMGEAGTPGEHHKVLDKFIGTWEGTYTWTPGPGMEPMKMEGRATREWIMGGRYVKETVTSSFGGEEFTGIGYLGYNNTTGEYQMCWIDSHSTGIYTESGSYDPTTNTLRTWSHQTNPMTGKAMHTQSKLDLSSSGRQSMVGYATGPNGQWYKMFEGEFEKVN